MGKRSYSLIWAIAACTICGAEGKHLEAPGELYQFLLQAQNSNRAADAKMIGCMTQLSELLTNYHRRFKKFPESASELESFNAKANLSKPKNPYREIEVLARELPTSAPSFVDYKLEAEYGLSRNGIEALAKRPPKAWIGVPGTITIMHNSENSFAIRGCGLDGKPITDHATSNVYVIFKELSEDSLGGKPLE